MKKLAGFLLIAVICMFPIWGNAYIIGNVNLQQYHSAPIGGVTFPSASGNYYLDYDVSLNGVGPSEAFCVEDMGGPGAGGTLYTLLSIDSGLSVFGLDANKYLTAAWVAQNYIINLPDANESEKASAQIAIWEIIFDYGTLDLTSGSFRSSNSYNAGAAVILATIPGPGSIPTSSSNWALAVNPTISGEGQVTVSGYQNYLVQYSVPEPWTLLLLGFGLVGLAGIRRKFKK